MLRDIIMARHSVRKYTDKQISRSDLELILEAGNYAPNAGGRQRSVLCYPRIYRRRTAPHKAEKTR